MKIISKINPRFFIYSFALPFTVILAGILMVAFLVVLPYLGINVSNVMASPIVPQALRDTAGFSNFQFTEFSKESTASYVKNVPSIFYLSIPELNIKNAKVETNSRSLSPDRLLGHYVGTSLPGEPGNSLIYGHSAFPLFYNPRDYKTIFSTVPTLSAGDNFYITYGAKTFSYEVVKKVTMKPDDIDIYKLGFEKYGESTVTLFTCVPPGAKTYRLMVVGRLVRGLL